MSYHIAPFINTRREAMMDGAEAGDIYTPSAHGQFEVEADTVMQALEHTFKILNIGPAPTDARERSLSVGDAVVVDGVWYTCEGMGWAEMSPLLPLAA